MRDKCCMVFTTGNLATMKPKVTHGNSGQIKLVSTLTISHGIARGIGFRIHHILIRGHNDIWLRAMCHFLNSLHHIIITRRVGTRQQSTQEPSWGGDDLLPRKHTPEKINFQNEPHWTHSLPLAKPEILLKIKAMMGLLNSTSMGEAKM